MTTQIPLKAVYDGNGNATGLAEFVTGDTIEWNKVTHTLIQTPTYNANTTINWGNGDIARITLTGNIAITNTGAVDGQKLLLELTQDATGSRTLTFTSETRFGTDITGITLTTTANKKDRIGLIYDGIAGKYDVIAFAKGY